MDVKRGGLVGDQMDSALCERILAEVEALSDELVEAVRDVVRIDSVQADPEPGAPFGPGCRRALDHTLELAEGMGFETYNLDGYAGYASWPSVGAGADGEPLEGYVCAVGHLDVVPVGTGWKEPPFSASLADGTIYGRGVLDNKGPIYACLFALWTLRRLGLEPRREVRVIFGCNEETGMADMEHYLSHESAPVMGFTPDCKYPVVYAERGRARVRLAPKDAPASPSGAVYAEEVERLFTFVNEFVLNAKPNGERLGIDVNDPEFGVTQTRNWRLVHVDGRPCIELAVSYPAGITGEELLRRMNEAIASAGFVATLLSDLAPVRFERDCRLVRTLQDTYERVTGNDGTPVTTTGGTYAKVVPNIVPFGPSFPGQRDIGHQPNEWMTVEDLLTNAKIYALSLYQLSR